MKFHWGIFYIRLRTCLMYSSLFCQSFAWLAFNFLAWLSASSYFSLAAATESRNESQLERRFILAVPSESARERDEISGGLGEDMASLFDCLFLSVTYCFSTSSTMRSTPSFVGTWVPWIRLLDVGWKSSPLWSASKLIRNALPQIITILTH